MIADILVAGLGPAGRALAHRATVAGLSVVAIDKNPKRAWTATYGAWLDELPPWLPGATIAARAPQPVAWGHRRHTIDRTYVVLDTPALQRHLSLGNATVVQGSIEQLDPGGTRLASGEHLRARLVVDARGIPRSPRSAEQTAYGVLVPAATARILLDGASALFMDWRAPRRSGGVTPSFLYAVPVGGGRWLLEETCLAGRPALGIGELRQRLHDRLAGRGIDLDGTEPTETVRFPLRPPRGFVPAGVLGFGARGGLGHPATGYSVAASMRAADAVAAAVLQRSDPARALHSWRSRAVSALRAKGLASLLALPPSEVAGFFDVFFELPPAQQRAYLSGREDLAGLTAAMTALFARVPSSTRARLARSVLTG
ncbi:lycopene cyclase family protein [Lolliginicoccus suaedae]|uniref:lycopene cyclase family protein n=1 Tax=Lolliginicoccus suaedae TaxID=2605429 RepID=UPI001F16E317|nr:lycopene cyclase family protein [Lolliginicoccus suaedae]